MQKNYRVIEVTEDNENKYLNGIVELEDTVYERMIKQGKMGQLFTTGRDDISGYIHSKHNSVFIVVDENDKPIAATYITQGQIPFTYNDITKYFKFSTEYAKHVKSEYKNESDYLSDIRKIYIQKIAAFIYSRDYLLKKYVTNIHDLSEKEKNSKLLELIQKEIADPENNFHEKSIIREELNKYMSLYMDYIYRNQSKYEKFYWVNMEFLKEQCGVTDLGKGFSKFDSTIQTYDAVLALQRYAIYEKSKGIKEQDYFEANTNNTIELDTYITSDNVRENGLARILVFEGIKRVLQKQKMSDKSEDIYLVSTLHRDNYSSKYVSEFFGLKDNLFVNRRTGRDREVHIYKIEKGKIKEYLDEIEAKLIVLYDYNPNKIKVSGEDKKRIILEQIAYEKAELDRLQTLQENLQVPSKNYESYINFKKKKISKLQAKLDILELQSEKDIVDG